MMKLTEEQKKVVESHDRKIVVMACAGAGKTLTMIERIRWILNQGGPPEKMVAITFTNNAADEIKIRLGEDYKEGMFIGTVHGYANHLLTSNGYGTSDIRSSENFDELFARVKQHPDVVKPIGFLALDEAQDSSANQFDFIFNMLQPKNFIIFGDIRQSIYGFNSADPSLILSLMEDETITVYDMIENHRNGKEIIKYSNWILDKMVDIPKVHTKGQRHIKGIVDKIPLSQIANLIKNSEGSYGDWAILCRSNKKIQQVITLLQTYGIPAITFRQAQGTVSDLEDKMKSDNVKVLTIHSAKGLEWPKVIVADQSWKGEDNLRLMYVAATRGRDELYWLSGR